MPAPAVPRGAIRLAGGESRAATRRNGWWVMKIKTYRATDRTTALKQIREELGPEAVIVYERRLHAGAPGLFGLVGLLSLFGRSPKPEIEILAAVEDENLPGGPSSFPPRSVGEGHSLAGHLAS